MTQLTTGAAFWILLPFLVAAVYLAVRNGRNASRRAKRVMALERSLELREAEARHLVDHRLPTLMNQMWRGQDALAPAPLHPAELNGTQLGAAMDGVIEVVRGVTAQASERGEEAAQAAVKTVTRSMQALINEQQATIMEMLERHHDEKVLHDASAIDHASSQLGRRAQIIGVLTGSWPGRQRVNSPLLDVVRGGVSRIRDYQRVQVIGEPPLAVISRAVEPVVLAIAEMLDNAARHSEPGSHVQVWFLQAHNGVSIVIDDSGVGLKPEDAALAKKLLAGSEPVRLTELRNPPKFGHAAVGVLAARYGFRASVDSEGSPFGGVRAVIYLPKSLLAPAPEREPLASEPLPAPAEPAASRAPAEPAAPRTPAEPAGRAAPGDGVQADEVSAPASPAAETATEPVAALEPVEPTPATRVPQSSPSAVPTEPQEQPALDTPLRADGLPQRRRRRPQPQAAPQSLPRMQPPTNASGSLGAFVRGRRAAQQNPDDQQHPDDQQNQDERNV
ncbi:ATP-binding protein [Streptomyces bluensis]|uniref:ATP-binding protein n=1 Tax=Streptomyces bluensis TaxID=33897 RepID=UPI0033339F09